jgi:regulator of sirC expression with transglutaminase-like and TPR domain
MDQDLAILRLLADDDPGTVALVRTKLAEVKSLESLRELHVRASGVAARRLESLMIEVGQRDADAAFLDICTSFGEQGDLEEASWRLAASFSPGDDLVPQRELLISWAHELGERLKGAYTSNARVDALVQFLGRDLRLRGNDDDYYNLNNSILPRVIETRLGIPITLALVYILVGKRARLQVDGVGLPGHFVARHQDVFFDPFHGGRRITLEECGALLRQQNLALTPQHLAPTTPRQMLLRMLTNIYYIADQSDPPLAAKVSRWAELLKR